MNLSVRIFYRVGKKRHCNQIGTWKLDQFSR